MSALLNKDDGTEFELPKHQHCACHLLNLPLMPRRQHPMMRTRKCSVQSLPSVMHFVTNVKDLHLQLKLWKMPVTSSCCVRTLPGGSLVHGSGKTSQDPQRKGRSSHQRHLRRLEGSSVSNCYPYFIFERNFLKCL